MMRKSTKSSAMDYPGRASKARSKNERAGKARGKIADRLAKTRGTGKRKAAYKKAMGRK